ncbi:hypothetical protein H4R35_003813 [Dimargaris xerosporica]|nr:hypothetical protein H4R35_003813 [Dimargaris xerosporica]
MDSNLVQAYILSLDTTNDHGRQDQALQAILDAVEGEQGSLLSLVQALEEPLTSDRPDQRAKGIKLLASVVGRVQREKIPLAAAILTLSGFTSDFAVDVTQSLFGKVHVQSFQQTTRLQIFKLIQALLDGHLSAIQQRCPQLAIDFMQAMDGEKDPRNLMVCFTLFPTVVQSFALQGQEEELFEIVFCYFPITFKPPPGDALGITADQLKQALRRCITAVPAFGPYAVDPLVGKLSSTSGTAKLDALQTITDSLSVYALADIEPHVTELVSLIREELYQSPDQTLVQACWTTLTALFGKIADACRIEDALEASPHPGLRFIVDDLIEQVADHKLTKARISGQIVKCACQSSLYQCVVANRLLIPVVLEKEAQVSEVSDQQFVLDILWHILAGSNSQGRVFSDSASAVLHQLWAPYTERLFSVLAAAIGSLTLHGEPVVTACRALAAAAAIQPLFSPHEIHAALLLLQNAYYSAFTVVRPTLLNILTGVVRQHPAQGLAVTLELLEQRLPLVYDASRIDAELPWVVAMVRELGLVPALTQPYMDKLLATLQPAAPVYPIPAACVSYTQQVLKALQGLLASMDVATHETWMVDVVVPTLVARGVSPTIHLNDAVHRLLIEHEPPVSGPSQAVVFSVYTTTTNLGLLADCVALVVGDLPVPAQRSVLHHMHGLYFNRDATLLVRGGDATAVDFEDCQLAFEPLVSSISVPTQDGGQAMDATVATLHREQQRTVLLFAAVFSMLDPAVTLPVEDECQWADTLVTQALAMPHAEFVTALALCLTSWLNKAPIGHSQAATDLIVPRLVAAVDASDCVLSPSVPRAAVLLYQWVAKAWIVRNANSQQTQKFVQQLVAWLDQPAIAIIAAQGFQTIAGTHAFALTKAAHAHVKRFYRQRFFHLCIPLLVQGFRALSISSSPLSPQPSFITATSTDHDTIKPAYLQALTHLIDSVPKQVLLTELPPLMPMLLSALTVATPDPYLRINTCDTLYIIAMDAPKVLAEHIQTIVPTLVQVASTTRDAATGQPCPMALRTAALKCLGVLPDHLDYTVLHPYKAQVIKDLIRALDDPKRMVRQEAVQCRNKWLVAMS